MRQLDNGDLFLQLPPPLNEFIEMNMLGEIVRTWQPPAEYPIGVHEGLVTSRGTIMYLSDVSQVVSNFPTFDLSFFDYGNTSPSYLGYTCYRACQIPDLYPHPAEPVTDLAIGDQNQLPVLEFSADPTLSYILQGSTDLTNWTTLGTPVQAGGIGDYDFEDLNASQFTTRFYRVVTQ